RQNQDKTKPKPDKNKIELVGSKLVEKVGSKLAKNQLAIYQYMAKNPYITKRELSIKLKISTTAIDKNILKLKNLKLIKRIGPAKGGHWEIIQNG
ncbi:MAG: winged helix-turn-helix transcriptional regulator, partial [Methanosarcinales archaeon]|nr:winged helix-turn-helix transcriptional regulator [Methanosarcinales archaeon]